MKSIKRALCSVLVCFGAFMFCTGTADAAEGADAVVAESADNNFVDNNVTDNLATQNEITTEDAEQTIQIVAASYETAVNYLPGAQEVNTQTTGLQSIEVAQTETTDEVVEEAGENEEEVVKEKKKKTSKKKYKKSELRLMAAIISCEANSEPYAGKLAVGIVVMNRVKSKSFPNTIKGVIYQKSQFSPVRNGSLKRALAKYDAGKFTSKNEKQCIKAAKQALDGIKTVTYAGNTKNMKSYHYFSGSLGGCRYKIGGHMFK